MFYTPIIPARNSRKNIAHPSENICPWKCNSLPMEMENIAHRFTRQWAMEFAVRGGRGGGKLMDYIKNKC
jgi:hypothetical protein